MKTLASIPALRREMAAIRNEITAHKSIIRECLGQGETAMAEWHLRIVTAMEERLRRRAFAIRRGQRTTKGGCHG